MKNIKIIGLLLISAVVAFSCETDDKLVNKVLETTERGAVLRTLNSTNTYNFYDTADTRFVFDLSFEAQGAANGADPATVRIYQSFIDNAEDGVNNSKAEVLMNTIDVSTLSDGANGFPEYTLPTMQLQDALDLSGLSTGEFFGGDQFVYRLELESKDGRVFTDNVGGTVSGGSFFTSPFSYTVGIKCVPVSAIPGDYTIVMTDSFGDGWQTTDANAGAGMTVTLDDGTVIEFGMCSPYTSSNFTCTPGNVAATTTVTIPETANTMLWEFPGDFYGEISVKIIAPNGVTALEIGEGEGTAGELFLNICL